MQNERLDELLRALPILRTLPPPELTDLAADRVERPAEGRFFEQGDPADAVYGVITGRVQILKRSPAGRELCLEVLGPGDAIAAAAVIRGVPMPASCVAMEPTALIRVPAEAFRRLLARNPGLGNKLLDLIASRLLEAARSRVSLATDPAEARIARVLLHMCDRFGAERGCEVVFSQTFTRQNLADLAATTPETTIRVMSRWTRAGWIRSQDARITVLAPDAIRAIAGQP